MYLFIYALFCMDVDLGLAFRTELYKFVTVFKYFKFVFFSHISGYFVTLLVIYLMQNCIQNHNFTCHVSHGILRGFIKVKVKLKSYLCLPKHHTVKTYWGVEEYHHVLFGLGTRWR